MKNEKEKKVNNKKKKKEKEVNNKKKISIKNLKFLIPYSLILTLLIMLFVIPYVKSFKTGNSFFLEYYKTNISNYEILCLNVKNFFMNFETNINNISGCFSLGLLIGLSILFAIGCFIYLIIDFFSIKKRHIKINFKKEKIKNKSKFKTFRINAIYFYIFLRNTLFILFVTFAITTYVSIFFLNYDFISFLAFPALFALSENVFAVIIISQLILTVICDFIVKRMNIDYRSELEELMNKFDLYTYIRALSSYGKTRLMVYLIRIESLFLKRKAKKDSLEYYQKIDFDFDRIKFEFFLQNDENTKNNFKKYVELVNYSIYLKNYPSLIDNKKFEKEVKLKKISEENALKLQSELIKKDMELKKQLKAKTVVVEKEIKEIISLIKSSEKISIKTNTFEKLIESSEGREYLECFYYAKIRKCNIISNVPIIDSSLSDLKTRRLELVHQLNLNSFCVHDFDDEVASYFEKYSVILFDEMDKTFNTNDPGIYYDIHEKGIDITINVIRHAVGSTFKCFSASQKENALATTIRQGYSYIVDYDGKATEKSPLLVKLLETPFIVLMNLCDDIIERYEEKGCSSYKESAEITYELKSNYSTFFIKFVENIKNKLWFIVMFFKRMHYCQINATIINTDSMGSDSKNNKQKQNKVVLRWGARDENYFEYDTLFEQRFYKSGFFENILRGTKNEMLDNVPTFTSLNPSDEEFKTSQLVDSITQSKSNKKIIEDTASLFKTKKKSKKNDSDDDDGSDKDELPF